MRHAFQQGQKVRSWKAHKKSQSVKCWRYTDLLMLLAIGTGSCADNGQNLAIGDTSSMVLPIQGRHCAFFQRLEQARAAALKIDDLALDCGQPLALGSRGFRT